MRKIERVTTTTIAISGVQRRIGTTTQAMQLVGYLKVMGYSVAYVDLTGYKYLEQIKKLYKGVTTQEKSIMYSDIEMYESIPDLKGEPYDFLVKDYGSMSDKAFNRISYLEQDIQIICCGSKPNEMFEIIEYLKQEELKDAHYIFSFVPPDQKKGILNAMENRGEQTYFASYNPDLFSYDSSMNKSYRNIMGNYLSYASVSGERKKTVPVLKRMVKTGSKVKEMVVRPGKIILFIAYSIFLGMGWLLK